MARMNDTEWRDFVSAGRVPGVLSTVRKGERAHAVPVWFVLDGDDLVFTTPRKSIKGRTLLRTRKATLLVADNEQPYSFAMIEGEVELEFDPKAVLDWTIRVHERYVDADLSREASERLTEGDAEMVCRLKPTNVFAIADVMGTFGGETQVSDW